MFVFTFLFLAICKLSVFSQLHTQLTLLSIKCKYCGSVWQFTIFFVFLFILGWEGNCNLLLLLWLIRIAQLFHQYALSLIEFRTIFMDCALTGAKILEYLNDHRGAQHLLFFFGYSKKESNVFSKIPLIWQGL